MKLKPIITSFCLAAIFALTSCLNSNSGENTWRYNIADNFTQVTDAAASTEYLATGTVYALDCDLDDATATLTVNNLRLTAGGPALSFTVKGLRYGYNNEGAFEITASSAIGDSQLESYQLTGLKLIMFTRTVPQVSGIATTFSISFTLDGTYAVRAIQDNAVYTGTTSVSVASTGTETSGTAPYYAYSLNVDKKTAKFIVYNLRVADKYYKSITFDEVPFEITAGNVTISSAETLTPSVSPIDLPKPAVTAFTAKPGFDCRMTVGFLIDGEYYISATLGETTNAN